MSTGPYPASEIEKRSSGGRLLFHRLSIGSAAALALAGVLTFAAIVRRLAAALAFAGVLAFTGVAVFWIFRFLRLLFLVLARGVEASLGAGQHVGSLNSAAARQKTGEGRTNDQALS